jgi:hypothetical protein
MTRLLLLCALIGAAYLYLQPAAPGPAQRPLSLPADAPLVPAPVARAEPAPDVPVPVATATPDLPKAPEPAPRESRTVARRASPIPTSPLPPALAALESPTAGLVARRQPVTELLPDGTTRPAGGPTEQAPPLARRLPRAQAPEAQELAPKAPPTASAATLPPPAPRPSQADAFFKNAARILAETEIPK